MAERGKRPNILWIGVDQLRADTLSSYGNTVCQTPNLDNLARRGTRFTNAHSPSSLCTPARGSMFTGRYAFCHGMGTNCDMYHSLAREMPDPSLFLHYRLRDAGYRLGYVGKWHVGTDKGPAHYGFEGMSLPGYGNIRADDGYSDYLARHGLNYHIDGTLFGNAGNKTLLAGLWNGPVESTPAHYLANYTTSLIDSLSERGEPFFITTQFWAPHMPHLPSREYYQTHDRSAIEPWRNFDDALTGKPEYIRRQREDFYRTPPEGWEQWRELVGLYYDATAMVDAEIGRIVSHLEKTGLADNTVIIFTSDHGDMTGSHAGSLDKGFMYEEAHRVPLMFCWPGAVPEGRVSDELVSNMDIFPTLLDLTGVDAAGTGEEDDLDGLSLTAAMSSDKDDPFRDELLLEFHGLRFLYSQRGIVTRDGWKYIFTPGDRDEVYNLNDDPGELENLIEEPQALPKVEELRRRLEEAAIRAGDPLQDCIGKYFGRWENRSGQPDATTMYS